LESTQRSATLTELHSSNVIEYLTSKCALDGTVGLAFAYYNYQSPELAELPRVLAALVKQLCRRKGEIPAPFLKVKQDAMPPSELGDREPFITAAGQFNQTFLVVDALDECKRPERYEMLQFLREIVDSPLIIKVLVTSRRETDIEKEFELLNRPTVMVEARNVAADIEKYVTDEVQRLRGAKRLYVKSDKLELEIIKTLRGKADGMYVDLGL
jgi:hypothetical protein